jgi:hypothetical protein
VSLRGNIFVKVFIGFWLLTVSILGSWLVADHYFDSRPDGAQFGAALAGRPTASYCMIYQLQKVENGSLAQLVEQAARRHGVEIYLLDTAGKEIRGRNVPEAVSEVAGQLRGARRRAYLRTPEARLLAHDIYRSEQGPLRIVFAFPATRHDFLRIVGGNLWLRPGLAVLISGLVCFGLSRLLTGRLRELQHACRRLQRRHRRARERNRRPGERNRRHEGEGRQIANVGATARINWSAPPGFCHARDQASHKCNE